LIEPVVPVVVVPDEAGQLCCPGRRIACVCHDSECTRPV
jgi:hypothetical protein